MISIPRHGERALFAIPDPSEYIQSHHAAGRFYEEELLDALREHLSPDDLVLDVGANIGNHTVYFAAICGCRVIAIEPDPDNFRHLEHNVRLNGLGDRVTLLQAGAGEIAGLIARIISRDPSNTGATRIAPTTGKTGIQMVRLDDIPLPDPPKLLKVDTEGMDLAVLRGARGLLSKYDPIVAVESERLDGYIAIAEFLEGLSYVCTGGYNYTPTFLFAKRDLAAGDRDFVQTIARALARAHIARHDRVSELDLRMRDVNRIIADQKESLRAATESLRAATESERAVRESARAATESLRAATESERAVRESARAATESARAATESARAARESARAADAARKVLDHENKNLQAKLRFITRSERELKAKLQSIARAERALRAACHDRDRIIRQLARRLGMVEESTSYRVGALTVHAILRPYLLPVNVSRAAWLLVCEAWRRLRGVKRKPRPVPLPAALSPLPGPAGAAPSGSATGSERLKPVDKIAPRRQRVEDPDFERELRSYLDRAAASDARHFVFMFSGTTFIQERRGNRPIRLANAMLEQAIPVLFSYYRWRQEEPLAESANPLLLQSPIDLTETYIDLVLDHPLGQKTKIFVASIPHVACARAVNALRAAGWVTIYDVRDDWEEFHRVGQAKWYREELERYLVNNCDVVCAVSEPLRRKMAGWRKDGQAELSPNALDTKFLSEENAGRLAPRAGDPVVGYFGHLTASWFDWENLCKAAEMRPDWTFEIIGHFEPEDLALPRNVNLLGSRTHKEINTIAKRWRAAIIPFRIGKLADGVDPIKIYEYLALGLPTVSFTMPQIADYPYTHLASNVGKLVAQLEIAMCEPLDRAKIDSFLSVSRWEDRVQQFLSWSEQVASGLSAVGSIAAGEALE